ncbi:MAG: nickel pincer cofactor biosynthesis protein LarB [Candidatus Korobacteraceae bacterium]
MNSNSLQRLLEDVRTGRTSTEQALRKLRHLPFEDIDFAKIDHHRALRAGTPEVIYAAGKSPAQVAEIFARMARHKGNVLATRAREDHYRAVRRKVRKAIFHPASGCITLHQDTTRIGKGLIAVVAAGTSDLGVAEEAQLTAELMGNQVTLICDVGVAGLHRLFAYREVLDGARVVIVCAGMEGALPSAVAGLVAAPVVAVPTSVGYGASFGGIASLLGMLNSCAPNVSVVNIDNGFGAACVASAINRS